jgi:23S rRNA (adenine2503-C2)-methyltransferase
LQPKTYFPPMNILSMTYNQIVEEMKSSFGKGAFHAAALYREVFKKGNRAFITAPEFAASEDLAKKLAVAVTIPSFRIIASRKNDGGVTKFATTLGDENIIETVILPWHNRTTVCVSSQVGCAMGCAMCQTGTAGFVRNLSVEEIISQIYVARFEFNLHVDNVVFMGMGEPFDNFDNVLQAIRVLSDQRGFAISPRAITVSTAGVISGIEKLATLNMPTLRFAVSINAADNDLRSLLMPINKKYPLADLKKALSSLPLGRDGVIFVEYVLIAGVNDSPELALKLVDYLQELKVRVNVIAFNQSDLLPFTSPTPEQVKKFCDILTENHLFVRIRQSQGREICAACGQLRGTLTV